MKNASRLLACLLGGAMVVAVVGCKKNEDPAADPNAAAGGAATATATATAAPTATMTATATVTAKPATTVESASIAACCSALHSQAATGTMADKAKYDSAAKACDGIASSVKSGATTKSSALGSIRAALGGKPLPSSCN